MTSDSLPIIDVSSLASGDGDVSRVAEEIGLACRDVGFFYIVGHGVDELLMDELELLSRQFFATDETEKMNLRMALGGRAWRGYFPVGSELTLGKPDQKEGLYFGSELPADDPRVAAGLPLHGANLIPPLPGFRECLLTYLDCMTRLGHQLMEGVAISLGLPRTYFFDRYTCHPLILFRIFHYPPLGPVVDTTAWSVGEHTDYGILTILRQDEVGGLQVKSQSRWIDAPPISNAFVCNIGDMLDRMTSGVYRSTPHRVHNASRRGRLSFPFFFDPNFESLVKPIHSHLSIDDDQRERWDQSSVHAFQGTYGEYLVNKVRQVFPGL